MQAVIDVLKRDLTTIRTGRATPALIDRLNVEYYGTPMPLNQLASISAPEPRLLVVQPWDKGALAIIEKALQKQPAFVDAHMHLDKTFWGEPWRPHSAGPLHCSKHGRLLRRAHRATDGRTPDSVAVQAHQIDPCDT